MPIIESSNYIAPLFLTNGHVQTILPTLYRRVNGVWYQRERIETSDSDFLDLDWSCVGSNKLGILSHGLESDSNRWYIRGMARALNTHGWDSLAWNFRGCSGEPNRKEFFYHSGFTEDLHTVISHAIASGKYQEIALIGFSLGGNITLKYCGERGSAIPAPVKKAVCISVPCDLYAAAMQLSNPTNYIYLSRFLRSLHQKIVQKKMIMPTAPNDVHFKEIRTLKDYDDRYTAALHGFKDAEDYYSKCSSKQYLKNNAVPTLILNAKNDPFLAPSCYPVNEANESNYVFLEMPESGGHLGFMSFTKSGYYWSELRSVFFLSDPYEATAKEISGSFQPA
ncbi:MAG: alpha/beta fold hydrolase [Chlorobiales bacterium]|nr:alpha/beta fold hydrolase [Chlorobiales bacterium]